MNCHSNENVRVLPTVGIRKEGGIFLEISLETTSSWPELGLEQTEVRVLFNHVIKHFKRKSERL